MLIRTIFSAAILFAAFFVGAAAEAQGRGNLVEYGYQREECPFEFPSESLVVCGGITVPENRENNTGRVYLPIVRIMHAQTRAETPAVVLGGGGPGGLLQLYEGESITVWNDLRKNLLGEGGELILLDPRGSGESWPSLTCPDTFYGVWETLHLHLDAEEDIGHFEELSMGCVRWWNKRVHLASYTTDAKVEDMETIRRVLGIKEWDIIGLSYGTRLALELIRRYPDGVRAAVLDSVVPADSDALSPRNPLETVLTRVAESCARDVPCNRYGNLRKNLDAATKRIADESPLLTLTYPEETVTVALTPFRFFRIVQEVALYWEPGKLPRFARDLADGKWNSPVVSVFVENALNQWLDDTFAETLLHVVNCRENILVGGEENDDYIFPGEIYQGDGEQFCLHVNDIVGESRPFIRPPVISDKPMIVIAGEYDIATPVEHAQILAERLVNAQLLTMPRGHTPLEGSPCALEITRRFLEAPNAPLSKHCAVPPLEFD